MIRMNCIAYIYMWGLDLKTISPMLLYTGIGRALVKALAQCGAEVIAFSRTQTDLDSLKIEVNLIENMLH